MITYYVNQPKGTVAAKLVDDQTGQVFVGKSKCSPDDKFSLKKGETIARLRAILKLAQWEAREAYQQYDKVSDLATKAREYSVCKFNRLNKVKSYLKEELAKI